jgi:hypothetical protein
MCPPQVRGVVSLKSQLEANGVKCIWLLAWDGGTTPTNALAQSYYSGHGVDFGWFTDDRDNSVEPYLFHNSPMVSGVPTIIIIDADDMTVAYVNPSNVLTAVTALAAD